MGKLTAQTVRHAKKPGLHGDGGGLYLKVTPTGTKSWVFRFRTGDKQRYHGLGSADVLSLAEARDKALECRKMRLNGIDPIDAKKQHRIATQLEAARAISFEDCAKQYIEAHKSAWKNAKHAWQWEQTLSKYAYPVFGKLPVADVTFDLVLKVLEPIPEAGKAAFNLSRWASYEAAKRGDIPTIKVGKLKLVPIAALEDKLSLKRGELDFLRNVGAETSDNADALN